MSKDEKKPSSKKGDADDGDGASDEENNVTPSPPTTDAPRADGKKSGFSQADLDAKAKAKARARASVRSSIETHQEQLYEASPPVLARLTLLGLKPGITGLEEIHEDAPTPMAMTTAADEQGAGAIMVAAASSSRGTANTKGAPGKAGGRTNRPTGLEELHDDDDHPAVGATAAFGDDTAFTDKLRENMREEGKVAESKYEEERRYLEQLDDDDLASERKPAARQYKSLVTPDHGQTMVDDGQINNLNRSVINAPRNQIAHQDEEIVMQANTSRANPNRGQYYAEVMDDDETLEASALDPIEGFLVPTRNHDDDQQVIPLFEGVPVPDDPEPEKPSCWESRRTVVITMLLLIVAGIIAGVAGTVITSPDNKEEPAPQVVDAPAPTSSPTLFPPPLNCTVEDFAPVYESELKYADYVIGKDGDALVTYRRIGDGREVQYMSVINGSLEVTASYERDQYIGEMAFSSNSFFASDLSDDTYGAMVISPKDPSGGISNETIQRLGPNPDEMDVRSWYGDSFAVDEHLLVVGADEDGPGSVFIYRQANNLTWSEEEKLVPDDSSVQNFGSSVLVINNVVIVAAKDMGVFFYEYDPISSSWQQLVNNTFVNDDCDGGFASSLALSGDDGLLVGCPLDNVSAGAVYYYQKVENGQYNYTQTIAPEDGGRSLEKFSRNNHHLAVNSEGDRAAIGTFGRSSGLNEKVYIFAKFDNVWREVAQIVSPKEKHYFGNDVVISGDRILITAWENAYSYRLACVEQKK